MRFASDVLTSDRKMFAYRTLAIVVWRTIDTAADNIRALRTLSIRFLIYFHPCMPRIRTPHCHTISSILGAHLSNEDKWLFSLNSTLHKYIEWKFVMRPYIDLLHNKPSRRYVSFDSSCSAPQYSATHTHITDTCIRHFISQCSEDKIE